MDSGVSGSVTSTVANLIQPQAFAVSAIADLQPSGGGHHGSWGNAALLAGAH